MILLKWAIQSVRQWCRLTPRSFISSVHNWRIYFQSYREYTALVSTTVTEKVAIAPYVHDRSEQTPVDATYFYQDAWAFERILAHRPEKHVDVGSYHVFVSLLSKAVPVTMVDIRPLPVALDSLEFQRGSILEMPFKDESITSISSICVIEHIGLGRYGDPLDPLGSVKAISELKRVLAPGGKLFISVPVGDEQITYFNANRVFKLDDILAELNPLIVTDLKFIVGQVFQSEYAPSYRWGTTACIELTKPMASSETSRSI